MRKNISSETPINVLTTEAYIIYLRKSRTDNPNESVEEVLAKHEEILQEYAIKHLGGMIPEKCIYREILSGETIDERPEMKKVLELMENPELKAVMVVDPQRLSRGDLEDCGKLVNTLRYSGTQVITPNMTYDLTNKMERKFFEQELLRGNDFLEYTKEILLRGRISAVKRGCYIGTRPPFGYDKCKIGDDHTLKPNADAEYIKFIFEEYASGTQPQAICYKLDEMGVKPAVSERWSKATVKAILKNVHYIGKVRFNYIRNVKVMEHGQLVQKRLRSEKEEVIIAEGLHPAIVSDELWEKAQGMVDQQTRHDSWKAPLQNPLAGVIFCKVCERAMTQHPYKHAQTRIECRRRHHCHSRSVVLDELVQAVAYALEMSELPKLEAKAKNGDGQALVIQQKHLERLQKEMDELNALEERQFDFLENGTYTEEMFTKRHNALIAKKEKLNSAIYDTKKNMPKEVNYEEKIVKLKEAVKALKNDKISNEEKNRFVKSIVKRIDFTYEQFIGHGQHKYSLDFFLRI